MNELIHSQSPYLQQHAHNPVHWKMWSEEAFQMAQQQDKPVIISIGYATCHWCHVMEKESFEDAETAEFMNEHFICIKVDREELPHVDKFYMDALLSMQNQGGWPLNMFTTPDKNPFYGGTYFPPTQVHNRASWRQILESIIQLWNTDRDNIFHQGHSIKNHLENIQNSTHKVTHTTIPELNWDWHKTSFLERYDFDYGGWYNAPKFPQFLLLNNLVQNYIHTQDEQVYHAIRLFWVNIIEGGLYDSIEGGVFRYAVDNRWRIPHFEKMLYDNTLMIESLAWTIQHIDMTDLKPILEQQIEFVQKQFKSEITGLYHTAFDADSEGIEGYYYLLNQTEWNAFLEQDFPSEYYNTEVIHHNHDKYYKINLEIIQYELADDMILRLKEYLLATRLSQREFPLIDTKSILSLNASLVHAFVQAAAVLENQKLLEEAEVLFEKISKHFFQKDTIHRIRYTDYSIAAQSEDIIFYIQAATALALMTDEEKYWITAQKYLREVQAKYRQTDSVYLSQKAIEVNDIPIIQYEKNDNITPSANSVYVYLLRLIGIQFSELKDIEESEKILRDMIQSLFQYPLAYPNWLMQYEFVRKGGLVKVYAERKESLSGDIYQKFGINNRIQWKKRGDSQKNNFDEIIIEQCFEDRCEVKFKGKLTEFEK